MNTSRRDVLKWLSCSPVLAAEFLSGITSAQNGSQERPQLCLVSRHVQWTDMEEGAAVAAEAGFKAIAWTVRPGAHIEPDRVERELPKAVEIARKAGLATPMIITAIVDARSPRVEAILDTLRGLGIRRYRAASFRYDYAGDLNAQF
ncbi:MAG: sugar phosphate isomerase/epimerase, partial [Acidobacteria bacterium]|nr:sugar phosphate isomerase/epimerase [Acidobacteriota bacterium]